MVRTELGLLHTDLSTVMQLALATYW